MSNLKKDIENSKIQNDYFKEYATKLYIPYRKRDADRNFYLNCQKIMDNLEKTHVYVI